MSPKKPAHAPEDLDTQMMALIDRDEVLPMRLTNRHGFGLWITTLSVRLTVDSRHAAAGCTGAANFTVSQLGRVAFPIWLPRRQADEMRRTAAQAAQLAFGFGLVQTEKARAPAVGEAQAVEIVQQARPGRGRKAAYRRHAQVLCA